MQLLDEGDTYYVFSFEHDVKALMEDLPALDFDVKCQVVPMGNSSYVNDSYNWHLSNMVFEMRKRNEAGIFDAVYLDGAHTFLHDGLAVCLLKELVKDGGYLILDDLLWSFLRSPTLKEKILKSGMPREQADDLQVFRVQELFLANDPNFEKLWSPKAQRGIFLKRSH